MSMIPRFAGRTTTGRGAAAWVLPILLAVLGCGPAEARASGTEFGGGVSGPDAAVAEVLSRLQGREGFHWIRSPSPRVPEFGFRGVSDVRLHVPRSERPQDVLPEDLFEVYHACRTGLPSFPGAPSAWEVWNEPDFYFVRDSAADMAAVLKAAWWGVKTRDPEARVLMPSLAFRPGRYAVELAANGLASWTDGWNVHFYGWAAGYPAFLAQQQEFAAAIGFRGPLWITEIGHLGMPLTRSDDPTADAETAAFHERTMVESWVRGVDRHLLFLLTPFAEARNELGLTRADGTWRPALIRAVRLARALQGASPRYRLVHRSSGEDIGCVLERDGQPGRWWIVLWSPARPGELRLPGMRPRQPASADLRLRPSWPIGLVEVGVGVDGETGLSPTQLKELDLHPGTIHHLHVPAVRFGISECRWVPWERSTGPRPRAGRVWRDEVAALPPVREPSPVVVRFRPLEGFVASKPAQTLEVAADTGGTGLLEFHNFTGREQTGVWSVEMPAGWELQPLQHQSSGAVDTELSVPPLSLRSVGVRILPVAAGRGRSGAGDGRGRMQVSWLGTDGSADVASVRLDRPAGGGRVRHAWGWRDMLPSPARPGAWQVFEPSEGLLAVEVRSPSEQNREVSWHLRLPRGSRAGDRFTAGLRLARGRGPVYVQIQMATEHGEVWRHGEQVTVGVDEVRLEAGLGDFSPAIWGRHRTMVFPPMNEVRWVSVQVQGVWPGDVLELREPSLVR